MEPRVLILNNAIHRALFKPAWHWRSALGSTFVDVIHPPSGQPVPSLDRYSHLILTGSEASILRPKAWFDIEVKTILEAQDRAMPILGSCFGHQMLVYALSGAQFLRRSVTPEVGWIRLTVREHDPLFADVPNPWHVFSFHFDEAAELPPPWKVLAESSHCPVHAIRYGDRPIWGIQPHPEISERKAEFITRLYLLLYGGARQRAIAGCRRPPSRDRAIHGIVQRFLEAGAPDPTVADTSDR
jgi:GMP synthase-like glutamine amidotransferase